MNWNNETVKSLRNSCKVLGVKGYSKWTKAELIRAIEMRFDGWTAEVTRFMIDRQRQAPVVEVIEEAIDLAELVA